MNTSFDASFPILTEVIPSPALNRHHPEDAAHGGHAHPADGGHRAALAALEPEALALQAAFEWGPSQWEALELDLNQRILRQLQGGIDSALDLKVRDCLADVLQTALAGLTQDLQRGLRETMEEVVAHTVAREIDKLQALNRKA